MSLVFNDTTTYKGIVQMFEKEVGQTRGTTSGDTDKLKELTADINLAIDDFMALAIESSGTWQFDDSNQTDYPILSANLVQGQRDYTFTTDGSGNLILDIFKVFVASPTGVFQEIKPVDVETDVQSQPETLGFTNGQLAQGTPDRYDKLANGIFLDPIPSYNYTGGLKMYVNREASYFTYQDTTKKPGFPGLFHRYLVLVAAHNYASRNNLSIAGGVLRNGAITGLLRSVSEMETRIKAYFASRNRDERKRLRVSTDSNQ